MYHQCVVTVWNWALSFTDLVLISVRWCKTGTKWIFWWSFVRLGLLVCFFMFCFHFLLCFCCSCYFGGWGCRLKLINIQYQWNYNIYISSLFSLFFKVFWTIFWLVTHSVWLLQGISTSECSTWTPWIQTLSSIMMAFQRMWQQLASTVTWSGCSQVGKTTLPGYGISGTVCMHLFASWT